MHGIPDGWRGGPLNALESKEWRDSGTCQKIRAPFSGWRQKPNAHLFEPRCRVYTRVYTRGPNLTKSGQMSIPSVIQVDTSTCVHGSRGFSPITTDIRFVAGGTRLSFLESVTRLSLYRFFIRRKTFPLYANEAREQQDMVG